MKFKPNLKILWLIVQTTILAALCTLTTVVHAAITAGV